jgi:hypothetical protein
LLAATVALVIQVVWHVFLAVLVQCRVDPNSTYLTALAFSVMVATDIVIVVALADLARRLTGERKLGAVIATVAYVAIAASTIAHEGFNYRLADVHAVHWWIFMMSDYGWYALDALAIVGFTLAAGRRAVWLAPIAIGAAILGGRPAFQPPSMQLVSVVLVAIKVALLVLFAFEAERHAGVPDQSRDRATRALRRIELITWFGVALTVVEAANLWRMSVAADLPLAIIATVVDVILAAAAWSVAQSRIPNMSRWVWYLAAIANIWAAARAVRSWFLSLTRHWGHFDAVPLRAIHWSQVVPAVLASLAALIAFAMYARRVHMPKVFVAALVAIGLLAVAFALKVAMRDDFVFRAACYLVLGIVTARICAVSRAAIEGELPRARVVG